MPIRNAIDHKIAGRTKSQRGLTRGFFFAEKIIDRKLAFRVHLADRKSLQNDRATKKPLHELAHQRRRHPRILSAQEIARAVCGKAFNAF